MHTETRYKCKKIKYIVAKQKVGGTRKTRPATALSGAPRARNGRRHLPHLNSTNPSVRTTAMKSPLRWAVSPLSSSRPSHSSGLISMVRRMSVWASTGGGNCTKLAPVNRGACTSRAAGRWGRGRWRSDKRYAKTFIQTDIQTDRRKTGRQTYRQIYR